MLLAFIVNSFVYFSFVNSYSSSILNVQNFQEQFHSGIYQHRVLSSYFLIWIYDILSTLNIDYQIYKLKFLNPESESQMYLSFYILNTIFIVLTAAMLVLITEAKSFISTHSEKILITTVAIFSIALSQFVVLPYDVSSYFFLLLFFYFLLQYLEKNSVSNLIILILIILISSLNRETAALSISLSATLLITKFGGSRESILPILLLVASFLSVYIGLRLISETFTTNDGDLLLQNFSEPKNILGILFWLLFFTLTMILSKTKKGQKMILYFHLFSFPYILMCIYSGIMYEIRLYIPLFLVALILGFLKINTKLKY